MVQFGGCCAVEGCHNQTYLDLHHLSYPQPGKRPEPGSIIVLCEHIMTMHTGAAWSSIGTRMASCAFITPTAGATER